MADICEGWTWVVWLDYQGRWHSWPCGRLLVILLGILVGNTRVVFRKPRRTGVRCLWQQKIYVGIMAKGGLAGRFDKELQVVYDAVRESVPSL